MIKRFTISLFVLMLFSSIIFSYGGNIPAGMPTTFGFGAIDKYDNQGGDTPTRWKDDQGTTCWDFNYNYLTIGWDGWQSPAGQWATSELTHWQTQGQETLFTYYYNSGTTNLLKGSGSVSMTTWFNNLITLFKLINTNTSSGKVTIVHIEPDLLGFCETGGMTASTAVSVASTGIADLSACPNTLAGWWQGIMTLRNKYASGKALVAIHYSHWADDDVFNSTSISSISQLNTDIDTVSSFLTSVMGSYPADLVAAESSDRDADWYAHVKSDTTRWANMDLTDPPAMPSHKTWGRIAYIVNRVSTNLNLRVILWQIPVGNTYFKTCNNSDGHYRENASQAILPATSATGASGTPGDAYSSSSATTGPGYWAAHGVIAVFFGEGTYNWVDSGANTTHLRDYGPTDGTVNGASQFNTTTGGVTGDQVPAGTSSSADNDGGYVRLAVAYYCAHTKYAIGVQPTATRTPTTGPSPTITPTGTATPFICSKVIYDGDNAGTNLAAGVVTNNSPATMTEGAAGGNPGNGMILNYVLPAATPYWQPLLWTPASPINIVDNTTLRFEVKANAATAPKFVIVIDWGSTAYQIDVNNYVTGGITNTWQTAVIPLSVLKAAATTQITFVDFINGNNTAYIVYVDNIRLTGGACPTATPTISATYTRTLTRTVTNTPVNTFTNTLTITYTVTRTNSPTYTFTSTSTVVPPTATYTLTFTRTASPTYTYTLTFTSTLTGTPTRTLTNTPVNTSTFTVTLTNTPLPSVTNTNTPVPPTATFTGTLTRTSTNTPVNTPTFTSTRTATPSATPSDTASASPTYTFTRTPTGTFTPVPNTATFTSTLTQTSTNTPVNTPTFTSTRTATPSATPSYTASASPTYTFTRTPTGTFTPVPPTGTFTGTATNTPTATITDTRTNGPTPSSTVSPTFSRTATATGTSTPVPPTSTFTQTATSTRTATSTVTNTAVPPTSTFTQTATPTRTPTSTATFTGTATISLTATITDTRTNGPTPSSTVSPTFSRTATATATFTATSTFTRTATSTATNTSVPPTATFTQTSTNTPVPPTATYTRTATSTATNTPVPPTDTFTRTSTITSSPTITDTRTNGPTPSSSVTPSVSQTPTYTRTWTASATMTASQSGTPTHTNTVIPPSPTYTGTATNTQVPPTQTYTRTSTATFTETVIVPSNTPTFTSTGTGTYTVTGTVTETSTHTETPLPTATFTNTPYFSPTITNTIDQGTLPDLVITGMEITLQTIPGCVLGGEPLGTRVMFSNAGNAAAGQFDINLNGQVITVPGLATGANSSVWFAGQSAPGSSTAIIDSGNTVTESNEANNTYTANLPAPTQVATCSPTFSSTWTSTDTYTDTPTATNTNTATQTNTPTKTNTGTPTNTSTGTSTDTPTATDTNTGTPSWTPTGTNTGTATGTPVDTATYTSTTGATVTDTQTPTGTATSAITATNTDSPTVVPTAITPTPTIPEGKYLSFVSDSVLFYPNPAGPYQDMKIRFAITRSADKVEVRFYSASYRLVRRLVMDKSEVTNNLANGMMNEITIKKEEFTRLSSGTYYYVLIATENGKTARSNVDKIIILK